MKNLHHIYISFLASLIAVSCNLKEESFSQISDDTEALPIQISSSIQQEYQTRANDSGFCDKDIVGIYIVDYQNGQPGILQNKGNRADNVMYTFDEAAYKWIPAHDIFWKDKNTHIDIYGYYPYGEPTDVTKYAFEVEKDQRREAGYNELGGYEASDFLWGKAPDNSPTDKVIKLGFNHKMAGVRITLLEGFGFAPGEWLAAQKQVIILNTVRKSYIDLTTGAVTADGPVAETGIIPYKTGDEYRGIVVPQTIKAGTTLLSITIDGESYFLKKVEDIVYSPNKLHNFTMTVNKRPAEGGLEFVLSSESITVWENDEISHDDVAREYVIVNVEQAGTLDKCIKAAGKDIDKVRNLKLTGQINSRDFAVMRYWMPRLSALNLKEVVIVESGGSSLEHNKSYHACKNDEIPIEALTGKYSLTKLILPDKLKKICFAAFNDCKYLSGSLIIPEGVEEIEAGAFCGDYSLDGALHLPSTLKWLGTGYEKWWFGGAFDHCNFSCELKLPENLEYIGCETFEDCKNLYGNLILPHNLSYLGRSAFAGCQNLTGNLEIPQTLVEIQQFAFANCGFNGTLKMHDGLEKIGDHVFAGCHFRGELILPKSLDIISSNLFLNCDFSGSLILPEGLYRIGDNAFQGNWRLTGVVKIPKGIQTISRNAFAHCRSLEGIVLEDGVETICSNAFYMCTGLRKIESKSHIPPYVETGAFDGVAKDNFTIEVPEPSIVQYQLSKGWGDFKRISAYRNLVIRPNIATAINTSVTRDLVLTADTEWYVESQPDWVTLDKTSGTGKTQLKLTFRQMPKGSAPREGEIVFMLKGFNYKTRCRVTQYDYKYHEDEFVTLNKATKGNGINIVLLGDGYNAKDVSEGKLVQNITEAYGHFFAIEPYKTYKDYFNVYYAVSVSQESGIGSVNTIIYNKFNTSAKGGVTLGGRNGDSDFNYIMDYVCNAPGITRNDLYKTLVIMVPNTYDYGGICYMWDEGFAIAYCPMSDYGYPYDFRGVIQHEAGGHGFGKLGDEYIYHNEFIDNCGCTCCSHVAEFNQARAKGWFGNLSLSGKISEVQWNHLIYHNKYKNLVDIFEGGFMHTRGVYRSEHNSCMNNEIPYYSTISREIIVRKIKEFAGEPFNFDEFVAKDKIESVNTLTKSAFSNSFMYNKNTSMQHKPVFMGKLNTR